MIEEVAKISPIDSTIEKLRLVTAKPDIRITSDFTVAVRAYINNLLATDDVCRDQFEAWIPQKKQMTEVLNNERGMSDMEEMKVCINMPELLGLYVFRQFPEILENKSNMYKFMKAFPEFTVPKRAFTTKFDPK